MNHRLDAVIGERSPALGNDLRERGKRSVPTLESALANDFRRCPEASRAEPLIAEGLRREKTVQQRGRALHAFWLASTQLHQGKLETACHSAGLALDLTASIDSPRVADHVQEFHRRLGPYAREPSVLAFEQRMRQALG